MLINPILVLVIRYIEKNGFCDSQISPHFVSETFTIAKPVFNLYIFLFFLTHNGHTFLCHFKSTIVVYFVKAKKRYLVFFFSEILSINNNPLIIKNIKYSGI